MEYLIDENRPIFMQIAEALGLELAPVSLQQLIVHLTSGKYERKAVKVR